VKKTVGLSAVGVLLALAVLAAMFYIVPQGEFLPAHRDDPRKSEASLEIKILTWNILYGDDDQVGDNAWSFRKEALAEIVSERHFDVLCFQEVRPDQLAFLKTLFEGYGVVSVGRNDGKETGEQNTLFYDDSRFELEDSRVFWLSDTPDQPGKGWNAPLPRICTWIQLHDRETGRSFRVHNTHMPLRGAARLKSAQLISERIRAAAMPSILMGDANAVPWSSVIATFERNGLIRADKNSAKTIRVLGKCLFCLDYIFVDKDWIVTDGEVIRDRGKTGYPSDHCGVSATVLLLQ